VANRLVPLCKCNHPPLYLIELFINVRSINIIISSTARTPSVFLGLHTARKLRPVSSACYMPVILKRLFKAGSARKTLGVRAVELIIMFIDRTLMKSSIKYKGGWLHLHKGTRRFATCTDKD
jgi:hypothetical protein